MTILNYAGILLFDATRKNVLLLKRDATKKLYPGRFSGIGGKLEPGESPTQCINREGHEEVPQLDWNAIDPRHYLTIRDKWENEDHIMDWFTAVLHQPLSDMSSEEGTLHWYPVIALPPVVEMTPAAYVALSFVLTLAQTDTRHYTAELDESGPLPTLVFTT